MSMSPAKQTPHGMMVKGAVLDGQARQPQRLLDRGECRNGSLSSLDHLLSHSNQFLKNNFAMTDSSINWSLLAGAETIKPLSSHSTSTSKSSSSSSISSSSIPKNDKRATTKADPWMPKMIGLSQDPNDWLWQMTEEPHRSRRRAILKDHPEIRNLMGHTSTTKWVSLFVVSVQLSIAMYFGWRSKYHNESAWSWKFFLTAYVIGGTANQNLFLAIHEITHNLAFKKILHNKLLAMFSNLPIGVPYAMVFKRYHLEHHKSLGEDGIDTDLPTRLELLCLKNVLGKAFFATFQIFFYALRPGFVRAQKVTGWIIASFALQLGFDYLLYKYFGSAALMYLIISSFMAGSLHPCAAHFIAEHYVWNAHGGEQETWSYYGPLNVLAYNVGYHNE
ncbi:sphingolipid delta-4 desaturase [Puccinia sorghi]|uniref:Sphingolipid delta-4 desaturase n=1 Tax=Puccinia sorghi TaxID=27349 RepID=A0A0L6V9X1_9BASI|nr:sphingolipid delta-4 desaturase [Puccinia sorghi]